MKEDYRNLLKKIISEDLIETRKRLGLSQEQMAEKLLIDLRSYADIEHGISLINTLSFSVYLTYYCSNPSALLNEVQAAFNKIAKEALP